MESIVIVTLTIATFATALGVLVKNTRQLIRLLSIQAAAVGIVEFTIGLIDLLAGLGLEALIDFFATFSEWFASAVVSPLIIYWCMLRTENVSDQPAFSTRRGAILLFAVVISNIILCTVTSSFLPAEIGALPFIAIMFSLAILITTTRSDPLKILIGLNMAENTLYPLFAESPLVLIPFMLALMIFVNVVGVFIITEAYRDYGSMSIRKWRWTG